MMKTFVRPLLAGTLACTLSFSPALLAGAQEPQSAAQPAPAPEAPKSQGASASMQPISLQTTKYNYSKGPRPFPNLINPYKPISIPSPSLVNSPKIEQLIQDGKLQLTLQDAVELALENSMDLAVQRYYPWLADVGILKAASGGSSFGTPGAAISGSSANLSPFAFNITSYDPLFSVSTSFDDRTTPINNPFISGTGTAGATGLVSHTAQYNTQYSQFFPTGTSLTVNYNNTRASNSAAANFFNPDVQTAMFVTVNQSLLSGFGLAVNRRNIVISKNNRKIADLAFTQQAITTVTNTITAYWELVYARENVKVQQQAVTVAEKLYNDNKKQLEIGTMAPLDVTRAQSELATDRQNLIAAQTTQLQDEQTLKNAITKNPLDPKVVNVEIIPKDLPAPPAQLEAANFEQALSEAFQKRPELLEQDYNLKNAAIDVHATRNALLPTATLTATYGSQGLAGNSVTTTAATIAGAPVVNAAGQPVTVLDSAGNPVTIFLPTTQLTPTGVNAAGVGTSNSQVFHNQFPDYAVSLGITIPIRNRSLQADNQRAMLVQRQLEAQKQQLRNAAILDVRNTYIALEQDRARVEAARTARELQQQTFDAEQKKYQLGASTVYLVIQTQRDLIAAQGTELRALTDLVEAKANYERALGRTLDVNNVSIADSRSGEVQHETLIPGTLHGQVVGTEKLAREIESKNAADSTSGGEK